MVTVKLLLWVIYWRAAALRSAGGSRTHRGKAGRAGPQLAPRLLLKSIFCTETQKCSVHFSNNADVADAESSRRGMSDRPLATATRRFHTNVPTVGEGGVQRGEGEESSYERAQSQNSAPCSLLTGPARRRAHQQ